MKNLPEDRLNHLSLYMPAVIYSCLTTNNFPPTFISESVKRLMGYEPCEFINTPSFWADHIHPDEKEAIFKGIANLFIHDKHSHQYRFKLADGTYLRLRMKFDEKNLVPILKKVQLQDN